MRTCVITKEKLDKRELLRIVRTPEKEVILDLSGKLNGRGAYFKKNKEVIEKAKNSKVLERVLGVEIPDRVYEEAIKMCE